MPDAPTDAVAAPKAVRWSYCSRSIGFSLILLLCSTMGYMTVTYSLLSHQSIVSIAAIQRFRRWSEGTTATLTTGTDTATYDSDVSADASRSPYTLKAFVVALTQSNAKKFYATNRINSSDVAWWAASDGRTARVQQQWQEFTDVKLNTEKLNEWPVGDKGAGSPHVIGVYMSHYQLWRTMDELQRQQRRRAFRSRVESNERVAYVVFEDDAVCSRPHLMETIQQFVSGLPADWDMAFIGGKSFRRYAYVDHERLRTFNHTPHWIPFDKQFKYSRHDILHLVRQGILQKPDAPLNPMGRPEPLSRDDAYWRTFETTNTHAYIIRGSSLGKVINLMNPRGDVLTPLDIRMARFMGKSKQLKTYIRPYMLCEQTCPSVTALMEANPMSFPGPRDLIAQAWHASELGYMWHGDVLAGTVEPSAIDKVIPGEK